jgi:hypothetical protein
LVQIISILGARRRELRVTVSERLRVLDARAAATEARHSQLATRLAQVEGHLERLDDARSSAVARSGLRHERILRLRQQLDILHGAPTRPTPPHARMHQLGSALMYVGGLLVLWVVLLELGLALGLN